MRQRLYSIRYLALLLGIVTACNPNKDKWLNRNYHTLTGRFNVYFNGEIKYIEALETLEKGHQDDYTKVLSVFPYGDEGAAKAIGGQMDEVLKKVSLSIQNHNIGRYTDDSYLLMGKAHFMKRDYYASMEAFQYINSKYKDKGLKPIATCWIAKCYDGLKKTDEAEAIMGLLLSDLATPAQKPSIYQKIVPPLSKKDKHEIYATAADIAIKQGKYQTATQKLIVALDLAPRKAQRIRYTYILGQLSLLTDSVANAKKYFTKILYMNAPYDFEFNANLNLAKAFDTNDQKSVKRVRKSLKRMLKDDKNDGHYDQIWYELGNLDLRDKQIPAAIYDYKMAAGVQGKNQNQRALAYLALGSIYLEQPNYKLAQAYYDSTAATLTNTYKDYKKIIDKRNMLTDLIANLVIIDREDSLQAIARLSDAEIQQKIDQWIAAAKLDSAMKAKKAKDKKVAEEFAKNNPLPKGPATTFGSIGETGQWYFYNQTLLAQGMADFFTAKKWGQRANEDYWRIAAMEKPKSETKDDPESVKREGNVTAGAPIPGDSLMGERTSPNIGNDRKSWIKDVPFTAQALAKSNTLKMDAYYNIGVLYQDKLSDRKEAIKNFNALLIAFPTTDYEPEVLYRLYKLYSEENQTSKAEEVKTKLLSAYPESPFAALVQNKSYQSAENTAKQEVKQLYQRMYDAYQAGDMTQVKGVKKEVDANYPGNAMQAKFDLLNAMAIGKTDGESAFEASLNIIVSAYPKTNEAERAQQIIDVLKRKREGAVPDSLRAKQPDFVIENGGPYYAVIAIKNDKLDVNELLTRITAYNEEYNQFDNLKVNPILSNDGYSLFMIRDFQEYKAALGYQQQLVLLDAVKKRFKYEGPALTFVVSISNFKKMLKEQKIDAYNGLFSEYQKSNIPK
ncbi:MAG: hypothetical protein MUE96_02355 [Bacteroidia bacterium]|nr:hypothetical protein [Bacteroidia bacterium]